MKNNPFIWFSVKFIKSRPRMLFMICALTIILSVYIVDFFILLLGLLYIVFNGSMEMIITCFLIPQNDIVFLFPFSPCSFIQKQSSAMWLKSFILVELGLVLNTLTQHNSFLKMCGFSVLIALFIYSLCLFICSMLSILSVKTIKWITNIIIMLVTAFAILIKTVSNEYVSLIIISMLLFIFSNLNFKKLSFKILSGGK